MTCTYTIPVRTVSEANRREHWAAKAKRAKELRSIAFVATHANVDWREPGLFVAVRKRGATITLTRLAPRALDSDNLAASFKAVRDGIADSLGINDGDERIEWRYAQRKGKPREFGVQVTIEAME